MGVGKRVCRRNANFDVIICCCVETLMAIYYLGACECMLVHACVCVCVCWGGDGEREREREQKYSHYKLYKLSNFAMCN